MNDLNTPYSGDGTIEARLWNYIDGLTEGSENEAIEKLIIENAEWKSKYQELLNIHQLIAASELDEPSMRFSKNVMEEISKYHIAPATKEYINKKIIWGIAAFFITAIVGFLIYGISQINWATGNTDSGIGINFTQVDYSAMFNNTFMNAFMMLNIILGLMLFDRFLEAKKKQYQNVS